MDYTSIHIYGHFLSDDVLKAVEQDSTLIGNREQDFGLDAQVQSTIDYAWSSLRNDWRFYNERKGVNDPYGTRRSRDLMERLFNSLGYNDLTRQGSSIVINGVGHEITYLCPSLKDLPIIVIGDKTGDADIDTLDKCSLDYRAKGAQRKKSPHATMLEYLNNTENVYGIVANGRVLRLIRNTGQLVKLTYIEFDLQRMMEEDKYTEFCLMFRLLHSTRFRVSGDEQCIIERYFNMSIESGNRIRDGLSLAAQKTMEIIGGAAIRGNGAGNESLRQAFINGETNPTKYNKELIRLIYRILFLFIIEERNLVYEIPSSESEDYKRICHLQDIYKKYYSVSQLRGKSELAYLRQRHYHDLWEGLMDTFKLFENENFGEPLGIKPLGGMLFNSDTLHYLKKCTIDNASLLAAFSALNEFFDDKGQRVKINYSSLDVEEFGSVYEGILEKRLYVTPGVDAANWDFGFVGGLDRKSTSSYYTRPDLVQNLIKTTLVPVIEKIIASNMTKEEKIKALLALKVCDAASGSGHIVLAMARTIAWYVCTLRTGEDNPASLDYREALREVIQKCIYAVDYNPDAVELCKVVLWIEGYCAGKPLSFLDHHIRCGNSVVGVSNLQMLIDGVPKEALTAEDRPALNALRMLNREAVNAVNATLAAHNQPSLGLENPFGVEVMTTEQIGLAEKVAIISRLPENTLEQQIVKQLQWEDLMRSPRVDCLRRACDIYTYSFYRTAKHNELLHRQNEYFEEEILMEAEVPYTKTVVRALQEIDAIEKIEKGQPLPTYYVQLSPQFKTEVANAAAEHRYFHWCVEFPDVFAYDGGFDVMCGNPPWDKIKVEDKKWFEQQGRADIVNAGTAAQRKRAIANLPQTDPILFASYQEALRNAEAMSRFVRLSGRFKYSATGDIDYYPLFAENCMSCSKYAWGLVLPTGIAISDNCKTFFSKLVEENRLISLYDFENREALFDIHRMFKFCLLTAGSAQSKPREVTAGFYLTRLDHLLDPSRIYKLKSDDFALLNPNTKTCPIFRTSKDALLTSKIYHKFGIILNEESNNNPWNIEFGSMFHMSNDSYLFKIYQQLISEGAELKGNVFTTLDGVKYVPLYEGKMIWQYNHHFGTWPTDTDIRPNAIPSPSSDEWADPNSCIYPWYWIPMENVESSFRKEDAEGNTVWEWKHNWQLGIRKVSNATNERTCIISLMPRNVGVGESIHYVNPSQSALHSALFMGMLNSLPFDYIVRQKMGGSNMSNYIIAQLPVLSPEEIHASGCESGIVERVSRLCWFNHDLDAWMDELRSDCPEDYDLPNEILIWDDQQRAVLQAELDAIFAHLYGFTTEELQYILDPEDICGPGCINETFRVLKDNEIRQYGEYRTKRLVLEAWKRFGFDN